MGRRALTALLALALSSFPARAAAGTTVAAIVGPDGAALEAATDVERIRFGEARPVRLAVDDALDVGDELRSAGGDLTVVLACSEAASVTLTGAFRVAIMPASEGRTCLIDLFAGDAYMTGDRSTGLGLGDVMAGAERTQYRAALSRDAEGVRTELLVFDGEVVVRQAAGGGSTPAEAVGAGAVLSMQGARREQTALTARQLEAAARLYAGVDASRLGHAQRPAATAQLSTAYLAVLHRPTDADARLKLVEQQVRLAATGPTTLHQLARAAAIAPGSEGLEVATIALSAAVYRQRGAAAKAATREAELRGLDPTVVDGALRARKLDPAVVRRGVPPGHLAAPGAPAALQVRALAEPPAIHVLGETRVRIRVTTGDGRPVQGARVRVAAGGGSFGHAVPGAVEVTEAAGQTGADGVFVTVWGCRQCAPAYVLSVEAAREGFVPARAEVTVRVQ